MGAMSTPVVRLAVTVAVFCAALASARPARAIPEAGFAPRFTGEVLPWCLASWQFGTFTGARGAEISYAVAPAASARGALVVSPGRREPLLRYCEVVHDLRSSGYDVYLIDHRGQGWSDRLIADRERVHVDDFADYVADLATLVADIVRPARYDRVVGLGHSMGGAILTRYAELHPATFDELILSAPMLAVDTLGIPWPLAYSSAVKGVLVGLGEAYAPSQVPPDRHEPLAASDTTHSAARWAMRQQIEAIFPELTVGGSTLRWLVECLEGTAALRASAGRIDVPILLLEADADAYVERWGFDEVCGRTGRCDRRFFAGAFHDVLQETDDIRDPALAAIRAVLAC
jgi:lysophospholipase